MLRSSFGRGGWRLGRTSGGHVRKRKDLASTSLNLCLKLLGNLTGTDSKVLVSGFCEWIEWVTIIANQDSYAPRRHCTGRNS